MAELSIVFSNVLEIHRPGQEHYRKDSNPLFKLNFIDDSRTLTYSLVRLWLVLSLYKNSPRHQHRNAIKQTQNRISIAKALTYI